MTAKPVSFKSLSSTIHDTSPATLAMTLEMIMSSKCALKTVQFFSSIFNRGSISHRAETLIPICYNRPEPNILTLLLLSEH